MEPDIQVDCALLQLLASRSAAGEVAAPRLTSAQWDRLFRLASTHGVLGILLHNLRAPCAANADAWHTAERFLRARLVHALRLRRATAELLARLTAAGIPVAEFKGADFADHLYSRPNLRPTSDIDLLVPRLRLRDVADVLWRLDYVPVLAGSMRFATDEYGEQSWRCQTVADIEVDLHWNLINHPSLRRRASVGLDDLDWDTAGVDARGARRATPATRLVIAAAHAAYGHQFDRLLLLCDVREAARQLTLSADRSALQQMAARTGTRPALDLALGTTAHWLNDSTAADLRRRLSGRSIARPSWRLISHQMLLHSGGHGHPVRRRLLRELLKRAA